MPLMFHVTKFLTGTCDQIIGCMSRALPIWMHLTNEGIYYRFYACVNMKCINGDHKLVMNYLQTKDNIRHEMCKSG